MANRVYTSIVYASIRLGLWLLLSVVGIVDGFRHRQIRSKGWPVYYLLLGSSVLFVLRNIAFLGICIKGNLQSGLVAGSYGGYIFFSDVADAYWIFILLAISAGFCITRPNFGPHKAVCISIPLIFFVTSLIADFLLFSQAGLDAFEYKSAASSSVPPEEVGEDGEYYYDTEDDPLSGMSPNSTLLFIFATLANTMAFFMAWFYIYDTARSEWQALQNAGAATGGSLPTDSAIAATAVGSHGPGMYSMYGDVLPAKGRENEHGIGHSTVPYDASLLEEGENASHMYGDIVSEDLDAPKSVQDRIADRDKVRLMKNFFIAVSIYILLSLLVFFVPIFVSSAVDAALLILYDSLLWVFLAGLLVVFRLRNSNQFILLTEDGGVETTTELGVLYHNDDDEDKIGRKIENRQRNLGPIGHTNSTGSSSSHQAMGPTPPIAPKFTLDDIEEEEELSEPSNHSKKGKKRSSNDVNSSAEQHGVVVRPIPSDN